MPLQNEQATFTPDIALEAVAMSVQNEHRNHSHCHATIRRARLTAVALAAATLFGSGGEIHAVILKRVPDIFLTRKVAWLGHTHTISLIAQGSFCCSCCYC